MRFYFYSLLAVFSAVVLCIAGDFWFTQKFPEGLSMLQNIESHEAKENMLTEKESIVSSSPLPTNTIVLSSPFVSISASPSSSPSASASAVATVSPSVSASLSPTPTTTKKSIALVSSDIFINGLQNQGITGVDIPDSREAFFLFGTVPLNQREHGVSLKVSDYLQKTSGLPALYFRMYEISTDTENGYELIRQEVEKSLSQSIEASVVEIPQYGEKSFVIKLEENQKTMYLVLASEGRLLGIEYLVGENFSRHRVMDTLLKELFPPSPQ